MNNAKELLARKYAQAFLSLYKNTLTPVDFESIDLFQKFLMRNPQSISLLTFPGIANQAKEIMIKSLCKQFALPASFERLIHLLLGHKRIGLLRLAMQALIALYHEQNNTLVFSVTSAHDLDQQSLDQIKQFLQHQTGKNIVMSHAVDTDLIAGIRAQSMTLLWEYSIAKQLNRLSLTSIV